MIHVSRTNLPCEATKRVFTSTFNRSPNMKDNQTSSEPTLQNIISTDKTQHWHPRPTGGKHFKAPFRIPSFPYKTFRLDPSQWPGVVGLDPIWTGLDPAIRDCCCLQNSLHDVMSFWFSIDVLFSRDVDIFTLPWMFCRSHSGGFHGGENWIQIHHNFILGCVPADFVHWHARKWLFYETISRSILGGENSKVDRWDPPPNASQYQIQHHWSNDCQIRISGHPRHLSISRNFTTNWSLLKYHNSIS